MINVINAIEEKLQAQKDDLFFKDLQIEDLKKQLTEAETELQKAIKIIDELTTKRATK